MSEFPESSSLPELWEPLCLTDGSDPPGCAQLEINFLRDPPLISFFPQLTDHAATPPTAEAGF